MALVADVLADVVQDGGEVEPLAGPVVEAVRRARLVEERQRQARDLLGVVGGVVAALRQLDDAAAPDVRVALDALDAARGCGGCSRAPRPRAARARTA